MSHNAPCILIVDDDSVTGDLLCEVFDKEGFVTRFEQSSEAALAALSIFEPDVVVSDIRMKSPIDGLNLLGELRNKLPNVPVILMTAFGSMDTAVRAVRTGAFDYINKPFLRNEVISTVRRALSLATANSINTLVAKREDSDLSTSLVGRTDCMLALYKIIGKAADANAPILITGESGTGKELIARATHFQGKRHADPFVPVNCGALTETLLESELFGHVKGSFTGATSTKRGIFEQAKNGTVFLDEISETSPGLQVKLLRVLQEKEIVPVGGETAVKIGARVVAATNSDLDKLCLAGLFRRDLYYRLNVINLHLPPLRKRSEDIPLLVDHFIRKHTPAGHSPPEVEQDVLRCLTQYEWPGNVRELENVIERALALHRSSRITMEDLPLDRLTNSAEANPTPQSKDNLSSSGSQIPTLHEVERQHLIRVLDLTGGNRKRTAELLGINRRTLYRMAERFGVELLDS